MYLLLSIVLSGLLGAFLLMFGPVFGGVIAFAIIVGCLFRGIYLLNDLHQRISKIAPKKDKVKDAYEDYMKEKAKREENESL
jgi:large-conductance mechanosensitive channel